METVTHILEELSNILWGWPMIILLFGTHIFLTIRLKFPQRKIFTGIALSFQKDHDSKGDISPFASLATTLAATIGTGNIIGVATAIALGGPGAVLWCWLTGIFGIATKYGEGLLAIKYREKTEDGTMLGGPMYALEKGLHAKWLAVIFCIFTAIANLGIGSSVQSNSIAVVLQESYNIPPQATAIVLIVLVTLVIVFGIKGISKICSGLVPIMAALYIFGCLYLLSMNYAFLGDTLVLIVREAFSLHAAGGGMVGAGIMMAMRFGIARGLFSNESGMGSAPMVAAAAQTRNAVRQALISSTSTFWDTVIVCALTGLTLVSCIIRYPDIDYQHGAVLTQMAFNKIPVIGSAILSIGLITFAFSTILGWSYYANRAIRYLGGKGKVIRYIYRILFLVSIYIGAIATNEISLVWDVADCMNALMAIPNLTSLLLLNRVLVKETNKYLWSGRLDEYDPEIS